MLLLLVLSFLMLEGIPDFGSFVDTISNAFDPSLLRVFCLLVLIILIALTPLSGQALLTGIIHAIFDIE